MNKRKFKNEDKERDYWEKFDASTLDKKSFIPVVFPNLKPTSSSVSIRIPNHI